MKGGWKQNSDFKAMPWIRDSKGSITMDTV
jgi:hypothetical protein